MDKSTGDAVTTSTTRAVATTTAVILLLLGACCAVVGYYAVWQRRKSRVATAELRVSTINPVNDAGGRGTMTVTRSDQVGIRLIQVT